MFIEFWNEKFSPRHGRCSGEQNDCLLSWSLGTSEGNRQTALKNKHVACAMKNGESGWGRKGWCLCIAGMSSGRLF